MKSIGEIAYPAQKESKTENYEDIDTADSTQLFEAEVKERKLTKEAQLIFQDMLNTLNPLATSVLKPPKKEDEIGALDILKKKFQSEVKHTREPLLLSLYRVSPQCVDVALKMYEKSSGFERTVYNFGVNESGYKAIINPSVGRSPILQLLGIFFLNFC